jgi:hypothetical protein
MRKCLHSPGKAGGLAGRCYQADSHHRGGRGADFTALRASEGEAASQRAASLQQLDNRRRTVVRKTDRGYEDYVSDRITEAFWTRKSAEWDAELQTIDAERARLERTQAPFLATAEKTLELAKKAAILYKSQDPTEQRRLLETVLSNCTFDRGTLCPTYASPFDLFVKGNETCPS